MKCLKVFMLLGALATPGWAQEPGDDPDHGVARISVLSGDVTVRRGDTGEFVAAELNAPLVALDHLLTEENSRAEIQLDWANFVRLASESEIRLAELKDRDFLVQVSAGTVTFRVLPDSNSLVEISTPSAAIRPRKEGTYRITVRDDFSTEITVRSGEVEIFAGGTSDFLGAGQTLLVSGDPSNPQRVYSAAIPRDEFDRWNETRDRDLDRSDSYKYVSRDVYGAEDLAGYGRWVYDSPYGWVWVPTVATSWAPYRVGRWTWVNYYGWTWVSGDPWGWAPYHYGRWYQAPRYGWVWYPGEIRVRTYWRPALVGFFGWGANIGWVALAPHEVYRPWYGSHRTIVNNVTVVNNINVVGSYRNARFVSGRSGVTSVVAGNFGRGRTTINNFVVARDTDLKRAGDAGRWLPHEPSRENRQFSNRQVSARVTARREVDRDFVSTRPEWNGRNRGESARSQPRPADNSRRVDAAPQRNDAPQRIEPDRARQPEGNRGRGENPVAAAGNRPDNVRRPETPQRSETVAAPRNEANRNRSDNSPRVDTSQRSPMVAFPRNDSDRERQPDRNRGRDLTPASGAAGNRPDTVRRPETPQRNEAVVFPRNETDRGRQPEGNRGRGSNSGNAAAARPSEPERRAASSQPRETVAPPRRGPVAAPQPERNQGRDAVFARREVEQQRPTPASETFRRAEPSQRPGSEPTPQRQQEPQSRPGRFPGAERQAAPEASSPAPSSPPEPSPSPGNNSGGRGRGRR